MPVHRVGPSTGSMLQRRYRVAARIASGGMGTVFRGHDERLDRAVAIKLLHAHLAEDDEVRRRFRDEARHAARVRHHNVVAVLDQDEHDGLPFIVMELVEGPSLRDVLRTRGRLSPDGVVDLLTAACAGLGAVHAVGLVHRDIKPANLLHDRHGDVRVADFGIARALDSTGLTPAGTLLGSMQYMAPEVVLGQPATFASDQYSLGVVAFEALTGQPPLPADVPMAAAVRHAREAVPPPSTLCPDIAAALDRAILTATARDPADRHASSAAFLAAARAVVAARSGDDRPNGATDILSAAHDPTWLRRADADGALPRRPGPRTRAAAAWRPWRSRDPGPAAAPAPPTVGGGEAPLPVPEPAARADRQVAARGDAAPAAPQVPIYVRARMSALAIIALAFTLLPSGVVVSPLLGVVALRRIDRSHGALRGEAIAGLAVIIGLARLAVVLLQQG